MVSFLSLCEAGKRKCFRYHPIPLGKYAPQDPAGSFSLKGPSMLQSCGRSRVFQPESENSVASAPGKSPLRNFQPKSKFSRILDAATLGPLSAALRPAVANPEANAAAPTAWRSSWRRLNRLVETPSSFAIASPSVACEFVESGYYRKSVAVLVEKSSRAQRP